MHSVKVNLEEIEEPIVIKIKACLFDLCLVNKLNNNEVFEMQDVWLAMAKLDLGPVTQHFASPPPFFFSFLLLYSGFS